MKSAKRIVIEGEDLEDDEPEEDDHVSIDSTVEKNYWMAKNGLTLENIVAQTGERIEIRRIGQNFIRSIVCEQAKRAAPFTKWLFFDEISSFIFQTPYFTGIFSTRRT